MTELLTIIYITAAFLCSWRMSTLILTDDIFAWLRAFRPAPKFSPVRCVFCVTVWAGLAATAAFYFMPWLNFPLGFSQLALICIQLQNAIPVARKRGIFIEPTTFGTHVDLGGLDQKFAEHTLRQILASWTAPPPNGGAN